MVFLFLLLKLLMLSSSLDTDAMVTTIRCQMQYTSDELFLTRQLFLFLFLPALFVCVTPFAAVGSVVFPICFHRFRQPFLPPNPRA